MTSEFEGQSPRRRRVLLIAGVLLFIGATWLAVANLPPRPEPVRWWLLAVITVTLAPLTVVLSGVEFAATARLVDQQPTMAEAIRISVLSSAANLLPLPGSFFVRARALSAAGSSWGRSAGSPIAVGLSWIGVAALIAGVWLLASDPTPFAGTVLAGGVLAFSASIVMIWRIQRRLAIPDVARVIGVETAMVVVSAARYLLVLVALGFDPNAGQAFALALSSVLASAVGIVPGGLGLREGLAAAFAPLVSLAAAAGALAAAVNRVVGLIALAALAVAAALPRDGEPSGAP